MESYQNPFCSPRSINLHRYDDGCLVLSQIRSNSPPVELGELSVSEVFHTALATCLLPTARDALTRTCAPFICVVNAPQTLFFLSNSVSSLVLSGNLNPGLISTEQVVIICQVKYLYSNYFALISSCPTASHAWIFILKDASSKKFSLMSPICCDS